MKVGKVLVIVLIGLFMVSMVSAEWWNPFTWFGSGDKEINSLKLEDRGIVGMEISEINVNNHKVSSLNEEHDNSDLEIDFSNARKGIRQDIYIRNKDAFGSRNYDVKTKVEIYYSKIRWNGTVYDLNKGNYELRCWVEDGRLLCPSIFMDESFNKRINFKDVGEQGGYAYAYKSGSSYYVELIIDDYNIRAGERKKIDPTYYNQTDGFSTASFGCEDATGIWGNDSRFFITCKDVDKVFEVNLSGSEISNFSTTSYGSDYPFGIWGNNSDFWIIDTTDEVFYHLNLTGSKISTSIDLGVPLATSARGIWGNNSDFFISIEGESEIISNTNLSGFGISNFSLYPTFALFSVSGNDTNLFCLESNNNLILVTNYSGSNTDNISLDSFGMDYTIGLFYREDNFYITDYTDKFVYHVEVNATETPDTTFPSVTINTPLNQTYTTNSILFNITATDDINIDTCLYSLDSGATNYTMSENGDEYTDTNSTMAQGSHSVVFYCNDTSNNLNNTETVDFYIDSLPPYFTTIPATDTITYGSYWGGTDFNATDETAFDSFTVNNSDFTINSSGYLNTTLILGANEYLLNITINDTSNNLNSTIYNFTVYKGTPTGSISGDAEEEYPYESTITGSETNTGDDGCSYKLYRDGVEVSDPETDTLGVADYVYVYNTTGCANYSASASLDTASLNITQNTSLSLSLSGTSPINYGVSGDFQGSNCPAELTCKLYRDGVEVSNPDTTTLGAGTYDYNYNTTGNTNYSSNDTGVTTLTVNQISSEVNLTLDNSQSNSSIYQGDTIDLNCSTITGDSSAYLTLYNASDIINNGTSPIGNTTTFATTGIFNVTCRYEATQNYTASIDTWFVNVTTLPDSLGNLTQEYKIDETSGTILYDINSSKNGINNGATWTDDNVNITLLVNKDYTLTGSDFKIINTSNSWTGINGDWEYRIDNNSSSSLVLHLIEIFIVLAIIGLIWMYIEGRFN